MERKKILAQRYRQVVKANELIQKTNFQLNLNQQKIILYLISQISPYDDDFKLYNFSISDFCHLMNIQIESGKTYENLRNSIKQICDKSQWIRLDNGNDTLVRWIQKARINPRNGNIEIQLDEDLKPYLLQLKEKFTAYQLLWVLNFRSKFSIRLYEFVKSIHYNELEPYENTYSLNDLKSRMGADNYKTYQHFRERALEPAISEINKSSDKHIIFTPIKTGKAVTHIKLRISTKPFEERDKIRSELDKAVGAEQLSLFDLENAGVI